MLPCGKCVGCREDKAKGWALRCWLEAQEHPNSIVVCLTYAPENEPQTLRKDHLAKFHKRLRDHVTRSSPNRRIRFFACGEYGGRTHRPHYHSIIFGMAEAEAELVRKAWQLGRISVERANQGRMAYVAGYTAKKYGDYNDKLVEKVDPETGEVWTHKDKHGRKYLHQQPFLQMSMNPGIGGAARKKFTSSWRNCAVLNGQKQQVPRYLHQAWLDQATEEEKEKLKQEKLDVMKIIEMTPMQQRAAAAIALKKAEMKQERRVKI